MMRRLIHRMFATKEAAMPPLEYEELEAIVADPDDDELHTALKEAAAECIQFEAEIKDIDEQIEAFGSQLADAKRLHDMEVAKRAGERAKAEVFARRPEPHDDVTWRQVANVTRVLEATQIRRAKVVDQLTNALYWRDRAEQDLAEAKKFKS